MTIRKVIFITKNVPSKNVVYAEKKERDRTLKSVNFPKHKASGGSRTLIECIKWAKVDK